MEDYLGSYIALIIALSDIKRLMASSPDNDTHYILPKDYIDELFDKLPEKDMIESVGKHMWKIMSEGDK